MRSKEPAPPAPPAATPSLYMTPQWAKRRDGLCPSVMLPADPKAIKHAKSYRTNSSLLLQIRERDGVAREAVELQTLVGVVHKALERVVTKESGLSKLDFAPQGCTWMLDFSDPEAKADFRMQVNLQANEIQGMMNYLIGAELVPRKEIDVQQIPNLPGYKEGKTGLDNIALAVRKAVVGLEFPEFPEGCKGRPFREVYQLNARVRGRRCHHHHHPLVRFYSFYLLQLKSGSFATVCRGTHRATGRKVAIKCVLRKDLPPADDAAIYDEVAILASLNHPHIVPLIDFFDEKDCYFIVMELMSGGDLFDRIGKKKAYSEADARDLVVKMLKAVAYCHTRRIAHCDMKPKNLLLMSDDNDSFIKLADFGFAARVHEDKSLSKQCGTPFFVSPEILMRKPYDHQSDMWSVGCIVFLLLSGNLPFMGRSQKELFRKIVSGKYEFDEEDWQDVSDDAKDLVKRLLILNPDERITANEAIRHRWVKASKDRLSLIVLQGTSQRLKTFNARMKLRSAMIAVDWVSSLKRVSWMSNRNLNGGDLGNSGRMLAAQRPSSSGLGSTAASMKALKIEDDDEDENGGK